MFSPAKNKEQNFWWYSRIIYIFNIKANLMYRILKYNLFDV